MKELYTSVNNNFAPLSKVEGEMREIIREQEQRQKQEEEEIALNTARRNEEIKKEREENIRQKEREREEKEFLTQQQNARQNEVGSALFSQDLFAQPGASKNGAF